MRRWIAVVVLIFAASSRTAPAAAQSPEGEVTLVVTRLFDAMRAADGQAAEALFHPQARLQSIGEQNG